MRTSAPSRNQTSLRQWPTEFRDCRGLNKKPLSRSKTIKKGTITMTSSQIKKSELEFIGEAANYLEKPSFVIKVTNITGKPIEKVIEALPEKAQNLVAIATKKSLEKALGIAIWSINSDNTGSFETGQQNSGWTDWGHKLLTAATGAAGGVFGIMSLPIELPITTAIMLRGISSIADDYGHNLNDITTRLECLSVFAMGSPSSDDDAIDSAYFTSRVAMTQVIEAAAKWAAGKTAQEITDAIAAKTAPALIQMIAKVAARFNVIVTETLVAKAVPAISVATGALINAAFTHHFNSVARYHFGIRALEQRYGELVIRTEYDRVKPALKPANT